MDNTQTIVAKQKYTIKEGDLVCRKLNHSKTIWKRIVRALICIGTCSFLGLINIFSISNYNVSNGTLVGLIVGIVLAIVIEILYFYTNPRVFVSINDKNQLVVLDKFGEEVFVYQPNEMTNIMITETKSWTKSFAIGINKLFKTKLKGTAFISYRLLVETHSEKHYFSLKSKDLEELSKFMNRSKVVYIKK